MPTANITDRFLKTVERPERGFVRYWDEKVKGFLIHVYQLKISFYYERNCQRHLIGTYPTVTVPQAREAARELDFKVRRGYAKRVTQSDPVLGELVELYCARPKLRSEKWKTFVRHAIENDLKWSRRRVSDITPAMCRDMHQRLRKRGPTAANQIMQALGVVWNFARKQDPFVLCLCRRRRAWNGTRRRGASTRRSAISSRGARRWNASEVRSTARPICSPCSQACAAQKSRGSNGTGSTTRFTCPSPSLGANSGCPWSRPITGFWTPSAASTTVGCSRRAARRGILGRGSASGFRAPFIPCATPSQPSGVEAGLPEEVVGRLLNHASRTITGARYVRPRLDFLRGAMQIVVDELERRLSGPAADGERPNLRLVSSL